MRDRGRVSVREMKRAKGDEGEGGREGKRERERQSESSRCWLSRCSFSYSRGDVVNICHKRQGKYACIPLRMDAQKCVCVCVCVCAYECCEGLVHECPD